MHRTHLNDVFREAEIAVAIRPAVQRGRRLAPNASSPAWAQPLGHCPERDRRGKAELGTGSRGHHQISRRKTREESRLNSAPALALKTRGSDIS